MQYQGVKIPLEFLNLWLCSCYQMRHNPQRLALWFFRTRPWCHLHSVTLHEEGEFHNSCHYHKSRDRTQQAFIHMNTPICRHGYWNSVLNGSWGQIMEDHSIDKLGRYQFCWRYWRNYTHYLLNILSQFSFMIYFQDIMRIILYLVF
jgi:hypothetical protein